MNHEKIFNYNWLQKAINLFEYKVLSRAAIMNLLGRDGYLRRTGWINSFLKAAPIDQMGKALPWYTYAAIEFLSRRTRTGMVVFEYGSGNSTLWWASRVDQVYSCEHNLKWYERMRSVTPSNVNLSYQSLNGDYEKYILNFQDMFDIVIIDGRNRVHCSYNVIGALKPKGVVIWDNSDRDRYASGFSYLHGLGFKSLDFSSLGPLSSTGWCTSIFYRDENCLGI